MATANSAGSDDNHIHHKLGYRTLPCNRLMMIEAYGSRLINNLQIIKQREHGPIMEAKAAPYSKWLADARRNQVPRQPQKIWTLIKNYSS
jgi:hypothetical protein